MSRSQAVTRSRTSLTVATGLACLSEEERELGVALVELGAGITNVSLFAGGMLVGLTSIAMGAADITDDIASAFGTRRQVAERMKCFHGSANASPRDNHEMIPVMPIAAEDDGMVIEPAPPRSAEEAARPRGKPRPGKARGSGPRAPTG